MCLRLNDSFHIKKKIKKTEWHGLICAEHVLLHHDKAQQNENMQHFDINKAAYIDAHSFLFSLQPIF